MSFTANYERWYSLLRWVFVLYFLATPRVVGHRHADIREADGGCQSLANHLVRCHNSCECSVPDCQLHFHLSFALLPSDIPAGTTSTCDVLSASDTTSTGAAVQYEPSQLAYEQAIPRIDNSVTLPKHLGCGACSAGDIRRVFFGVWQI